MKQETLDRLNQLLESKKTLLEKKESIESDLEKVEEAIDSIMTETNPAEEIISEMERHLEYMKKIFNY